MSGDITRQAAEVIGRAKDQGGQPITYTFCPATITGIAEALAAAGLLVSADTRTAHELLRRLVMDWTPCDDPENCNCSYATAKRFLAGRADTSATCPECKAQSVERSAGNWLLCTACNYSWLADPSRTYDTRTTSTSAVNPE